MNLNRRTKEIGLELISRNLVGLNKDNPNRIKANYIRYNDTGIYNTTVSLNVTTSDNVTYNISVDYDRLNIQSVFKGKEPVLIYQRERLLSDYLNDINEKYHLKLTSEDIEDRIIPRDTPRPYRLVIPIHETNLAFYGEFTIYITDEEPDNSVLEHAYVSVVSRLNNLIHKPEEGLVL